MDIVGVWYYINVDKTEREFNLEKENLDVEDVLDIINTAGCGNVTVCASEILEEFTGLEGYEYPQDVIASEIEEYLEEQGFMQDTEGNFVEVE